MAVTAVFSDIHANLHALLAAYNDARASGAERFVCLGDVIDYAAHPEECIDIVRGFEFCLKGNHEAGLLDGADNFSLEAKVASEWTHRRLRPGVFSGGEVRQRWQFIAGLPEVMEERYVLYVHGSPCDPVWGYLFEHECRDLAGEVSDVITDNLKRIAGLCFVGHTHSPGVIAEDGRFLRVDRDLEGGMFRLEARGKAIVNVGSVGQPRDGDPKACYVLFEGDTVRFRRVEYNTEAACRDIKATGELPYVLGQRLIRGI